MMRTAQQFYVASGDKFRFLMVPFCFFPCPCRRSSCPSCKLRSFRCSILFPWHCSGSRLSSVGSSAHSFSSSGNSNESGLLFNGIARLFCNLCCIFIDLRH
ncbi:hypothetical protein OIU76_007037 [Salix suchowensis]|nr:hypothetical protein OIU76_007037 [Salix suchowensis]